MEQFVITYLFIWGAILVIKLFWTRVNTLDKFEKWVLSSLFHAWIVIALIVLVAWGVAYYKTGVLTYKNPDSLFKTALK